MLLWAIPSKDSSLSMCRGFDQKTGGVRERGSLQKLFKCMHVFIVSALPFHVPSSSSWGNDAQFTYMSILVVFLLMCVFIHSFMFAYYVSHIFLPFSLSTYTVNTGRQREPHRRWLMSANVQQFSTGVGRWNAGAHFFASFPWIYMRSGNLIAVEFLVRVQNGKGGWEVNKLVLFLRWNSISEATGLELLMLF